MKLTRCLLLLGALGILGPVSGQTDPQRDFVVSGKNVYMMLPQDFICGPSIQYAKWSPDGDRIAVLRNFTDITPAFIKQVLDLKEGERPDFEPEQQIIVWSSVTRKATTLMKLKTTLGNIQSVDWLAGSSTMVVEGWLNDTKEGGPPHMSIMLLSTNGQTSTVAQFDQSKIFEVNPSPYKPVAILVEHPQIMAAPRGSGDGPPREPAAIRYFGTDGVLSQPARLPGPTCIPFWSKDGNLYVMSIERDPNATKAKRSWYIANRSNGTFSPVAAPADSGAMFQGGDPSELRIQDLSPQLSGVKVGINAPTIVLSAQGAKDDELSVVTTDGKKGQISPKVNAVSYESQGSLMVRSMVKVPLEAYLKAKDSAKRTTLLSNAKQVALALIMHASDNDDNLLAKGSDLQGALGPYLKNNDILNGFNYTFGGGNMSAIKDPAGTILGYIDGPGGRAVAYTDGHCRWIPNQ